jgi:hypothetical protein
LRKLLALACVVAVAAPSLAWDKAATPKRRLEILAGAAKRADQGELASCFAEPPAVGVMENVLEGVIAYDKAVSEVYKWTGDKFQQEGLDLLGKSEEAVTPLHFLAGTTITFDAPKEDKDGASVVIKYVDADNFEGTTLLKLVKVGEDWRLVLDEVGDGTATLWPKDAPIDAFTKLGSGLATAAGHMASIAKGIQTEQVQKEQIGDPFITAKTEMKTLFAAVKKAREDAVQAAKDKASAEAADAAKKEEAARKTAEDEAAKKEAAKKEAAKQAAAKLAPPAAPPPAPVAAKKPDKEKDEEEEEKKPEPDNTGMYVVFGILGLACLVTVGILLSKIKGDKKGGRSGKRSKGSASSSSGRQRRGDSGRRRSGRKRRSSSSGGDSSGGDTSGGDDEEGES